MDWKKLKERLLKKPKVSEIGPTVAWPVHYVRDWRISVSIFAVGFAAVSLLAWQIYLSDKIGGGFFSSSEPETSGDAVRLIDFDRLKKDLLILDAVQADYQGAKASSRPIDPSI